jgi:5-methylcytosine-specific restriction endonuclease McrA
MRLISLNCGDRRAPAPSDATYLMRLNFCVACGDDDPSHLHHHHLVPRSCGGGDEESNIMTL